MACVCNYEHDDWLLCCHNHCNRQSPLSRLPMTVKFICWQADSILRCLYTSEIDLKLQCLLVELFRSSMLLSGSVCCPQDIFCLMSTFWSHVKTPIQLLHTMLISMSNMVHYVISTLKSLLCLPSFLPFPSFLPSFVLPSFLPYLPIYLHTQWK